jgi:hypothetical protein
MATDRTETYPLDRRGYQSFPDLITALGVVGTGVALPMLVAQPSFTLGRSHLCDLRVDEKYLASRHAQIERLSGSARASLRITNVSSAKNAIVYNGVAESEFSMGAGDWFEIGESRYYALNEEMRIARPIVMEVLGIRQFKAIDDLLISAVRDSARHVLLLGEPGCDQERLGRIIHQASHRRHNLFHTMPERPKLNRDDHQALRDACNGTVFVHLHQRGKLDERIVAALVHPEARSRLVICAPSVEKIAASFPAHVVNEAKQIMILPLRDRAPEIGELLDQRFDACRAQLRFSAFRDELRSSLEAYAWPGNLGELREAADILVQLSHCRSARQAARESPFSRGELRGWAKKLNLKLLLPLVPSKAA